MLATNFVARALGALLVEPLLLPSPGMIKRIPTRRRSGLPSPFVDTRDATETPYRLAITDRVSPAATTCIFSLGRAGAGSSLAGAVVG